MKKLLLLLTTILLTLGLVACGEASDTSSSSEKKEENKIYKIGETAKIGDKQITIKSAKFTKAAAYSKAEKGKVLVVEFEGVNSGDSEEYFGSEEFKISTPDGEQHEEYFGYDDAFMNDNVGAGKKITKKIYFDVPQDSKYELIYQPTFTLSSKTLTFEITPK